MDQQEQIQLFCLHKKLEKNAEGLLNTFITGKDYKQYLSWEEIDKYIIKQGYSKEAYMAFMQNNILSDNLMDNEIFKDYSEAFKPQIITKQLQKEWFERKIKGVQRIIS